MTVTLSDCNRVRQGIYAVMGLPFTVKLEDLSATHRPPPPAMYHGRIMYIDQSWANESGNDIRDLRGLMAHEIGHEFFAPRGKNQDACRAVELLLTAKAWEPKHHDKIRAKDAFMFTNIVDDQIVNISLVHHVGFNTLWKTDILDCYSQNKDPFYGYQARNKSFHGLIHLAAFDMIDNGTRVAAHSPGNFGKGQIIAATQVAKTITHMVKNPTMQNYWIAWQKVVPLIIDSIYDPGSIAASPPPSVSKGGVL